MTYEKQQPQVPEFVRPAVVTWFKLYAACLCILYLGTAAFSLVFFLVDPADLEMGLAEARIIGAMILLMGGALFVACVIPLVFSPRPWLWTDDLVIICLGMTSACCLPACIPLLIFWLRPETKTYYSSTNRGGST